MEFIAGISQNLLADLLKWIFLAVIALMVGWARKRRWRWATPALYALVTGISLYLILFGFLPQRDVPLSWWGLSVVLLFALGVLLYAERTSWRDNKKKEEIKVFVETYIRPLSESVRKVEARLREHLRRSHDERSRKFTLLGIDYAGKRHGRALAALGVEFAIPETGGIDPLHRKLREFCNAYHGLVDWVNHLATFTSYPLDKDPDYETWKDLHKLFHQELRKLLGKEKGLSTLKTGLKMDWPNILR